MLILVFQEVKAKVFYLILFFKITQNLVIPHVFTTAF